MCCFSFYWIGVKATCQNNKVTLVQEHKKKPPDLEHQISIKRRNLYGAFKKRKVHSFFLSSSQHSHKPKSVRLDHGHNATIKRPAEMHFTVVEWQRVATPQKVKSTGNIYYISCNVNTKTEAKASVTTRDWCQLLKKVSFIFSASDTMLRAWILMELFQKYIAIEFTLGEQGCVHPSSSFSCQQHIRTKWFVQLRRPFTTWLSSEV